MAGEGAVAARERQRREAGAAVSPAPGSDRQAAIHACLTTRRAARQQPYKRVGAKGLCGAKGTC